MPAMSPTMTEGNIASWKVKEGDSFSTGDVLLEIETDKAQMDVEAQDDGIVAKITQPNGAKGVKVGMRIAIMAEAEDDLSTLSIPEDTSPSAPEPMRFSPAPTSPQEETKSGIDPVKSSESQAEAPPSSKSVNTSSQTPEPQSSFREHSPANAKKQLYPLYPSVAQILHEKGISAVEADKISASGPKGRLLKGDVLAYLGTISSSYPLEESARISKLEHLDLSSVKIAPPPKAAPPPPQLLASLAAEPEVDTEIAVSISFKAVKEVQERIHNVLGVNIPIEDFIARAIEVSNMDLPRSKLSQPTADELFNQVLGLDRAKLGVSRGSFTPQIVALPSVELPIQQSPTKKLDIIDMLTGKYSSRVLWSGDHLFEGTTETLELLRSKGKQIVFVTNNSTKSRADYKKKLVAMGIPAEVEEVFGSAYSAAIYISRILTLPPDRRTVFVIGESGIETELDSESIRYIGGTDASVRRDITSADYASIASGAALDPSVGVVLVGLDFHINYLKLSLAYHYVQRGAVFLATNLDSTLPNSHTLFPGAGAISSPLVRMLGRDPVALGKPSQAMMDAIEGKFRFSRKKTCMVGDRLDTDIKFGIEGGLGGTLAVLTGVSKREDMEAEGENLVKPMAYVDKLGDLLV
ncbi:hypothetical protein MMC17_005899 [Xylographa soralifera]|nr:hypothetical protein [Xylographa soralifera]